MPAARTTGARTRYLALAVPHPAGHCLHGLRVFHNVLRQRAPAHLQEFGQARGRLHDLVGRGLRRAPPNGPRLREEVLEVRVPVHDVLVAAALVVVALDVELAESHGDAHGAAVVQPGKPLRAVLRVCLRPNAKGAEVLGAWRARSWTHPR
jgi:hypothetical protein